MANDKNFKVKNGLNTGGTITTPSHGTSVNWNDAYNDAISSVSFSSGTITLTSRDNTTVTTSLDGRYLQTTGGTLSGTLTINTGTEGNRIRLYTAGSSAAVADTFTDTHTQQSYIYFDQSTNSNDPGYIMHETSESSNPDERNEGVLHLVPSDDNSTGDYVSIHGTNDADCIKIHTSGIIETASGYQLQLRSDTDTVKIDDALNVVNSITAGGTITATGHTIGNLNTDDDIGQQLEYGSASVSTLRFDSDRWRVYSGGAGGTGEKLTVTDSGNVGIDRYNPSAKLEVNGSIKTTSLVATGNVTGANLNISNWNAAYNDKINSIDFNTSDGTLTLNQQDGGTVTKDLDGRYALIGGSTLTGEVQTPRVKRWIVNDLSLQASDRWYKVATVNQGNSGITIRGTINNHVEWNGTQKIDLAFFGRADNVNNDLNITGTFEVGGTSASTSRGVGIRVIDLPSEATTYNNKDVYIRLTTYSHANLTIYIEGNAGNVDVNLDTSSSNYVTTEPSAGTNNVNLVFDNTSTEEGSYVVENNAIKKVVATTTEGTSTDLTATGATVIKTINLDEGIVTSTSTRTLTLANLGYTGDTDANKYSLPTASTTIKGGVKLSSDTAGNTAESITTTASRTYGVQANSSGQLVVNVPWTDNQAETSTFESVTQRGNTSSSSINLVGDLVFTGDATETNQARRILFDGFDKEGTSDTTDQAEISHTENSAGHAGSVLLLKSMNDANDGISFMTHSSSMLYHRAGNANYKVWTEKNDGSSSGLDADTVDGYHANSFGKLSASSIITKGWNFNTNTNTEPLQISRGGSNNSQQVSIGVSDTRLMFDYVNDEASSDIYFQLKNTGAENNNQANASTRYVRFHSDVNKAQIQVDGHEVWHAGNDGATSGLDADTVDGIHGTSFVRSDAADTKTGKLTLSNQAVATPLELERTSTQNANIKLSNCSVYAYIGLSASNGNINISTEENAINSGHKVWHAGNDGSGSGLDADKLDGIQSSGFLRSNADDTANGIITFAKTPVISGTSGSEGGELQFGAPTTPANGAAFALDNYNGNFRVHTLEAGKNFQIISASGSTVIGSNIGTVWASGNDGAGSGLDADKLDGKHASAFLQSVPEFNKNKFIYQSNDSNGVQMPIVKGGLFTTDSESHTGAFKIKLPSYGSRMMMTIYVDIYDYRDGGTVTYRVSGYNYDDSAYTWHNTSVVGSSDNNVDYKVTFYSDTTEEEQYFIIGDTTSTWNYPQVTLRDFSGGFQTSNNDATGSSWAISLITSIPATATKGDEHTDNNVTPSPNIFSSYRRDTIDSSAEDFNDFKITGTYHVNNWSQENDVVQNGPTGAYGWGLLRVTNWQDPSGGEKAVGTAEDQEYILQEYFPHLSQIMYKRISWNGTWQGWKLVLDESKFLRRNVCSTATALVTFNKGINVGDLNNGGITGNNYNISGVNQITINDPGEGIIWDGTNGSGANVSLYVIDDDNDNIVNIANAAELQVNSNKVWTGGEYQATGLIKFEADLAYGADDILVRSGTFTVEGDADTYYPVTWYGQDVANGRSQAFFKKIQIYRNYNEAAPNSWNTATHKGGLLLDLEANWGGWGGVNYDIKVNEFSELYSTMVAKIGWFANKRGFAIWLRGGTAKYHFTIEGDNDPTVRLNAYDPGNNDTGVSSTTTLDQSTITNRLYFRGGSLYDGGNRVYSASNHGSGTGLDADKLDSLEASSFLRSDADDTATGVITLSGGLIVDGSIDSGGTDYGVYESAGTNIVLKGDASGRSGIFFESEKNGTNINDPTDYGFIQFHAHGFDSDSGESADMVIGTSNDSADNLILQVPYKTGLKCGYKDATSGTGLTQATIWHAGNDGAGTGLDADLLDGQQGSYYAAASSLSDYLSKTNYLSNWTRLGYGSKVVDGSTVGAGHWHKLATVVINGSYKDYLLKFDWTTRYAHGTASINIHSDNDNTADIWDPIVSQRTTVGSGKNKSVDHFRYTKSGSTVEVWIYTPSWQEFDYIRTDAITEGIPTITWYKAGDGGASKQETDPGGTAFENAGDGIYACNLYATNATIENIFAEYASITTIQADKIDTNVLNADKILTRQIQVAQGATPPTISGASITGGKGSHLNGEGDFFTGNPTGAHLFFDQSAGTFEIVSGTSGGRVEFVNDTIKVYDSSNNERVILGNIS